jgi:hypothetical protein
MYGSPMNKEKVQHPTNYGRTDERQLCIYLDFRCPLLSSDENRGKMYSSPMNKEDIQPTFGVDGLGRCDYRTTNIEHRTNWVAFP